MNGDLMNPFAKRVAGHGALASALLLGVSVQAQTPVSAAADIERQRQATRELIDRVNADKPRALDTATQFDRALPADMVKPFAEPAASPTLQSRLPQSHQQWVLPQLHPVAAPSVLRRPAAVAAKANASTPDFSRQKISFADLVGRAVIDFPEPDGGLGVSAAKANDSELAKAVFGLPDIVLSGLDYSPEIKGIVAREEGAGHRVLKARSDLLPTVALRMADGREHSVTPTATARNSHAYANASVRLSQPVLDYPAFHNWKANEHLLTAAQSRSRAAREDVAYSLVEATVNAAAARVTLQFSDELIDNLNAVLTYQDQRAQSGAASQAELERARSRVLAARQARLEQQAVYKTSLLELERLVGFVPRQLTSPYLNQLPGLPRSQTEIRELALASNAELTALKAEVQAQQSQVKSQYTKLIPTVVASLENDQSSNNGGVLGTRKDARALLVMNWSVSLGGKEVHAGREAAAELRELRQRLEKEENNVTQAVDNDFALLQAASLRISLGQQEQESALRVTKAVREQLSVGRIGSLLDALDASDRLYQARIRVTQALSEQMLAQAQLLKHMRQLAGVTDYAKLTVQ